MTDTGTWAGARLTALRDAAGKSQQAVAEATGLDRSVINALENGRRRLTPYYVEKIGPVIGVAPAELLPPEDEGAQGPVDPFVLLLELSGAVDGLRETLAGLAGRMDTLERELEARRRHDEHA